MLNLPTMFSDFIGSRSNTGARFYDALKDTGRRRRTARHSKIRSGDAKLNDRDRRMLSYKIHELFDNYSICQWMIRQHLNYIADLSFKMRTRNRSVNKRIEEWFAEWSKRYNCHAQRKHDWCQLVRLLEGRNIIDGDVFIYKIGTGPLRGSIQIVEGDRIKDPADLVGEEQDEDNPWTRGVRLSKNGIAQAYAVHKRMYDGDLELERIVRADTMVHHGTFDRPDQIRGVSPFTSAVNALEDIYELKDYQLQKAKLNSMLGAFITRTSDTGLPGAAPQSNRGGKQAYADADYEFEFTDAVNIFDMDVGEGIETIQDNTVAQQTMELMKMITMSALKALDIPYSFFSEDFTNFYGAKGAQVLFGKAAKAKRRNLASSLDQVMRWRLGIAIADQELDLPKSMTFDDLKWEWVGTGTPLWDPMKETNAHKAQMAAGLTSPQRVCREIGTDFEEVMEDLAEAASVYEKLAEKGVRIDWAVNTSSSLSAEGTPPGEEPAAEEESEEPTESPEEDTEEEDDEE